MDWIFEIEQTEGKQIADQLMEIFGDYSSAIMRVETTWPAKIKQHRETDFPAVTSVVFPTVLDLYRLF